MTHNSRSGRQSEPSQNKFAELVFISIASCAICWITWGTIFLALSMVNGLELCVVHCREQITILFTLHEAGNIRHIYVDSGSWTTRYKCFPKSYRAGFLEFLPGFPKVLMPALLNHEAQVLPTEEIYCTDIVTWPTVNIYKFLKSDD